MSAKDLEFIKKLNINQVWLMDIDFPSFKKFLCSEDITSQQAEQLKHVRRKFQLRKYRLENYYRKKGKISELIQEKQNLEMEKHQLRCEIESFKNDIFSLDFLTCMDQLEFRYR